MNASAMSTTDTPRAIGFSHGRNPRFIHDLNPRRCLTAG